MTNLAFAKCEALYQFERLVFFALDKDSQSEKLVFNRTITLKDAWAKDAQKT
jgi:glutaminyl-tRNA synthetase